MIWAVVGCTPEVETVARVHGHDAFGHRTFTFSRYSQSHPILVHNQLVAPIQTLLYLVVALGRFCPLAFNL